MRFLYAVIMIFLLFQTACVRKSSRKKSNLATKPDTTSLFSDHVDVRYAKGFSVKYENTYKEIRVHDPSDHNKILAKYVLVEEGKSYSASSDEILIRIPLKKIACVSTTHLPFLTLLGEANALVGFGGLQYVKNKEILELIKADKIKEVGFDHQINTEAVIDLSPDALMVYPYEGMNFESLKKAGIPLIFNAEYLEYHPLGKAEWIKFVAMFFNKEKEANLFFSQMEMKYNNTKSLALQSKRKPTIFSGKSFKGEWHVPGGSSFAAAFLHDAGADYLWKSDKNNNVLALNFEEVMDRAINADWWLIVGAYNGEYTLNDLAAEDERYTSFNAFKNKQVLYCNTYKVDYFGDGVAEPEIILNDLVYYLHPGKLKYHQPKYFIRLK